jgi:chemotaxis protein CheD
VGIGQLAVSKSPNDVLIAYGLGSCVGMSVYDPAARVAALVHVLLPDSQGKAADSKEPARYADLAVEELLRQMTGMGALRSRLLLKLAGGAAVLGAANAAKFKIGERNAEAILERIERLGLRAAARDLGGTRGRTLELHVATGKTFVRTAASTAKEL